MKKLIAILALMSSLVYGQSSVVQFPYFLGLQEGHIPPGVYLPDPKKNTAKFTENGLLLTTTKTYSTGAILLEDLEFSSKDGLDISYEYNIWGGNGTDGLILFLYDGKIPNNEMHMGAVGRSMGYTPNRAPEQNKKDRVQGLPGAYLGIALNISGNFKRYFFNTENRINGADNPAGWNKQGLSHVTLRGAAYVTAPNDPYSGYRGYPVLKTQATIYEAKAKQGSATIQDNGDYIYGSGFLKDQAFELRGGVETSSESDAGYRKAIIRLLPHAQGGFNVSVSIQHGTTVTPVIENFHYKEVVKYYENAEAVRGDFNTENVKGPSVLYTLDAKVPTTIKLGFSGITGGNKDNHLIRNLTIALPYGAKATEVNTVICDNTIHTMSMLKNGIAYGGQASDPVMSNSNIDATTFQFHDANGKVVSTTYSYTDVNGTWVFDLATELLTFKPNANFKFKKAEIRYSFKGKTAPFNEEKYRSNPALIQLRAKECPIYVNPSLQSKNK